MPKKDPKHCCHRSINRVMNGFLCNDCGAEFVPKDPANMTKWNDDESE